MLFVGDSPTVPTGFSRCTEAACSELYSAGHEVTLLGLHYYGDPHSFPYTIYPCQQPLDNCGQFDGSDRLPKLMYRLRPDVVVILQDPWNIKGYETEIAAYDKALHKAGLDSISNIPVVGWLAVDSKNQPGDELNNLAHVVVWTKFASDDLKAHGYKGDPSIVPLGVDSEIFYPQDQLQSRIDIVPDAIPKDAFIVGVVGRNQLRKRLDLTIQYFAHWIQSQSIDDAYLYLHVAPTGDQGVDIYRLCRHYNLTGRVILPQLQIGKGLSNDQLRATYNSFDILLTTTQGEGWGLPVTEAMACGVPCIVPNWSALGCWPGDCALKVPCSSTAPTAPLNRRAYTLGGIPDRDATVAALDALYRHVELRANLSSKGQTLASSLTWKRTGEMMVQVLESVVSSVSNNTGVSIHHA